MVSISASYSTQLTAGSTIDLARYNRMPHREPWQHSRPLRPYRPWQTQIPVSPTPATPTTPAPPSTQGDTFARVSSMVATGAGGGFASYKLSEEMAEHFNGFAENGAMVSFKGIGTTALKGAGLSALVSAGVSAVANGVGVATGKIDSSKAVTNVVGDTITGAVGGLGAVTLGGLGGLAMAKMGMTGLPITIATVAIGALGGVAASAIKDKIMNKSA
ncbi:MAG: hypothetical protein ACAI44_02245 [Candidatus Sericytochromatia bacterium]